MDGAGVEAPRDRRVRVASKKLVADQMTRYSELLKKLLDGQSGVADDTKRRLLQELQANFEAAVQENVLVNGLPWEEAPDDTAEDEAQSLNNQLDDAICETSRRRRRYPKAILPFVVRSLKAERALMTLYEQAIKPEDIVKDPVQESIMSSLSAAAPGMVTHASQVVKSINTLQKQAEGLCQVLNTKPSQATLEIHQEVFGHGGPSDAGLAPPSEAPRSRQPIKRAVEEAMATDCYVLRKKKTPE